MRGAGDSLARVPLRSREHVIDLVRANTSDRSSERRILVFAADGLQHRCDEVPEPIAIHRPKWEDSTICDVGLGQGLARRFCWGTVRRRRILIEGANPMKPEHNDHLKVLPVPRRADRAPCHSHAGSGENSAYFGLHFGD